MIKTQLTRGLAGEESYRGGEGGDEERETLTRVTDMRLDWRRGWRVSKFQSLCADIQFHTLLSVLYKSYG